MRFTIYRGFCSWSKDSFETTFTLCGEDGYRDELCYVTAERFYRRGWANLRFKYKTDPPSPRIDRFFKSTPWQDIFDLALVAHNDSFRFQVDDKKDINPESALKAMKEIDSWYVGR